MEIYGEVGRDTDILVGTMQHQHFDWTRQMLDSISSENWKVQIVLLDQGSSGGEWAETLGYWKKNPSLILMRTPVNLGIPKGWNTLVKYGLRFTPYVLVAPNDIIYRGDTIDTLMKAWEDKPFDNVIVVSSIWMGEKRGHTFEEFSKGKFKPTRAWTFTGFNGLIHQEFVEKIGLWDENLGPWWWNDTDMLLRIFKAGYLGMAIHDSRVWLSKHSTKQETFPKQELSKVYAQNKRRFFDKHKLDINVMEQKTWQYHYWITPAGRVMKKGQTRLNVGRGGQSKGDWLNVDIDRNLKPDVVDDARSLKTIPDEISIEIFASHVLEHIDERDVLNTLKVWHKKLKPGGKVTIFVPDVAKAWGHFFKKKISEKDLLITMIGADPTRSPFQLHRTVFWFGRLKRLMEAAGFTNVMRVANRGKRPYECGAQAGR